VFSASFRHNDAGMDVSKGVCMCDKIEKTSVTFRLAVSTVEQLKTLSRALSYSSKRDISHTDLIREAIEHLYPHVGEMVDVDCYSQK
jgi:hypothetical protein